ncbi:peptidase [Virgisporangium aliadipatigenens]|uniref:Peptidase n=1 Tax=Virgisporangium aliadipatigenens TaxID=741659 RepID=A0A8J4DW15_9ACTN|nr:peptidase [Virgisporangium aliadipatigenens]
MAAGALTSGSLVALPAEAGTGPGAFYGQRVQWHGCALNADDTAGTELDAAGAQCADITVPLDYRRPGRRTITVAVSRIKATDPAHRIGPLMINLGGPAIPVRDIIDDAAAAMGPTGAKFDLIGMDVRFSGRSTPIDCGWPASWIPRSAGADRESFDRMVALSKDLAKRCGRTSGDLLAHASSANIARDMDVVRAVLGAPRLSYLGYSYGSYIGAMYTQLFPRNAGRIVLDSAIDPQDAGVHLRDAQGFEKRDALREWATLAAGADGQLGLGDTPEKVLGVIDGIYAAAARTPLKVGRYEVDDTVMPALLVDNLADDNEENALQLASFVVQLRTAADTGRVTPDEALEAAVAGIVGGARSAFHSGQTAIECADAAVPRSVEWYRRDVGSRRAADPLFGTLNRVNPCAFWPAAPAPVVRIGNGTPALIVHADGDLDATPALNRRMHAALTGSRLVTLNGARTHGVYLFRGDGCVDATVNAYLDTGALPAADLTC